MIEKSNVKDIIPLNPMQEGMLFHYLSDTEGVQYFEHLILNIEGDLEEAAFYKAWESIFDNNEMLRVVFRWENIKRPVQIIMKKYIPSVAIYDFSNIVNKGIIQEEKCNELSFIEHFIDKAAVNRFVDSKDTKKVIQYIEDAVSNRIKDEKLDIKECCMKVILCKYNQELRLHIIYHHILLDGWSLGIILREFIGLYEAFRNNNFFPLPEKASFKEYYEKVYLTKNKEIEENYWKEYLDKYEMKQRLQPLEEHHNAEVFQRFRRQIPADTIKQLEEFARKNDVTLASILYAVWGLVLSKFNNTDDIVFGTTVSGRDVDIKNIGNTVGLFINTVPIRIKITDEQTVKSFISNIQASLNKRRMFESTSLTDIKKYLGIEGSQALFDSIVVIENYPLDAIISNSNKEMRIKSFSIKEYTNYPITLIISLQDGLQLEFIYDSGAYEGFVLEQMFICFETIIKEIINHSDKKLANIDVIDEEQFRNIIYGFNQTRRNYPDNKTIIQLFEEQVERNPDAIAVVYDNTVMTYNQLNSKAERLAVLLTQKGACTEYPIALMTVRKPEMIVGMLGILKAGAAYVPINPDYPIERKKLILKDINTGLLVTNCDIDFDTNVDIIDLRKEETYSAEGKVINHSSPDSLAYIIYTSGSTGTPKGIMVEHRSVVRLVVNTNYVDFKPCDRILLTCPLEFDVSVFEIWGTLVNGASLYLLDKEKMLMPDVLKETIVTNAINKMWMTTPLFNQMVQADIGIFESLEYLIVGGDALSAEYINKVRKKYNGLTLVNGYGPTENTVFSTYHVIERTYNTRIPIGKPIQNSTAYILDRRGKPLPIGAVGELCVGQDGVARGYLNKPNLTYDKFVDDPFFPGKKMYKTGDLARWMPDGTIDFLGRMDYQVKVRGFRIELQEIENILYKHEAVNECVVLVRGEESNDRELVAYITSSRQISRDELRNYLALYLPAYFIPSHFVFIDKMPITVNGKIDRKALLGMSITSDSSQGIDRSPQSDTEKIIVDIWKSILNVDNIHPNDNFFDIGGNSLNTIQVVSAIKKRLGKEIQIVDLFKYTTAKSLARFISGKMDNNIFDDESIRNIENSASKADSNRTMDIAIIGIAARFPGAENKEQFWNNIVEGVESISFFSEEELSEYGIDQDLLRDPNYVKAKGVLEDIEYFDASLFSYSPREAELMDPQVRLLHECTWAVLEDAGYNHETYRGRIGLYIGGSLNVYWLNKLYNELSDPTEKWEAGNMNLHSLSMPISYKMNLTGPSITVETACSSSLVAVHLACKAIMNGECNMAIAGGCSISLPKKSGYKYEDGMIKSPDGHCRAFDKDAKGTVGGDGIGLILIKKLENAVADRDHIYAVIKGSAINNDGADKIGFTAPSVKGQARVIREAHRSSGVEPESIGYIEAHGTGTALGDPIEIEALSEAFNTNKRNYCAVGSVKANIGHLDTAAGIAGLIKTVLALYYRIIPPSINFVEPNPKINFERTPFYINTKVKKWGNKNYPLRAGVSSFGIGGTNAHVVLEEVPKDYATVNAKTGCEQSRIKLIILSAKTKKALNRRIADLFDYMNNNDSSLEDIAYTLQVGRKSLDYKVAFIVKDRVQLMNELYRVLNGGEPQISGCSSGNSKRIVFMFPGQGTQYVEMGKALYMSIPSFKETVDKAFEITKKYTDIDMKGIWIPDSKKNNQDLQKDINQTEVAQVLLFIIEYSLALLLKNWGIIPDSMIGHSLGEYVAACVSGVLSLEDALKLVCCRAKFMQQMERGSMVSVSLGKSEVEELLDGCSDVCIAATNSQKHTVISCTFKSVEKIIKIMEQRGISYIKLHVSHAFHSFMMEPMLREYEKILKTVNFNTPTIPYISNLTGNFITVEQAKDPNYYLEHIRKTVCFKEGIDTLSVYKDTIYLEIGPGGTLRRFVLENDCIGDTGCVVSVMKHAKEKEQDEIVLLKAVASVWALGGTVDWCKFNKNSMGKRISLPEYPFEKEYYWKYGSLHAETKTTAKKMSAVNKIDKWFYVPRWVKNNIKGTKEKQVYMVFDGTEQYSFETIDYLKSKGKTCIRVVQGKNFSCLGDDYYVIRPDSLDDYVQLLEQTLNNGNIPDVIVYMWSINNSEVGFEQYSEKNIEYIKRNCFFNFVNIAKAIGIKGINTDIHMIAVTSNLERVFQHDEVDPFRALVKGAVNVIPLEYKNISAFCIDVGRENWSLNKEMLFMDVVNLPDCKSIAYRNGERYVLSFRQMVINRNIHNKDIFEEQEVYLITGGLGGIGLVIAEYLAFNYGANMVLTSRSGLPPKEMWEELIRNNTLDVKTKEKIMRRRAMEQKGAKVMIAKADVTNYAEMKNVLCLAKENLGTVNCIIHAAGVPDSGVLQSTTEEKLDFEMAPKVTGTMVIHKIISEMEYNERPKIILFSSVSSILGAMGQAGYTAANAFLDAYANMCLAKGINAVSINWDTWKETGMAFNSVNRIFDNGIKVGDGELVPMEHPTLNAYVDTHFIPGIKCRDDCKKYRTYISVLDEDLHWFLAEHKINNKSVLSGTTYIEMLRACVEHCKNLEKLIVEEIFFLEPMIVNKTREVRILIGEYDNHMEFVIASGSSECGNLWVEHARGTVLVSCDMDPKKLDLHSLKESIGELEYVGGNLIFSSKSMQYGPRWRNIAEIRWGNDEGIASVKLPEKYLDDMKEYRLHPAMLDTAVSFMEKRYAGNGDYLPFSFKNIRVYSGLESEVYSHVRKNEDLSADTLSFSCDIVNKEGQVLVSIEQFVMKRIVSNKESTVHPKELTRYVSDDTNYALEIGQIGNFDSFYFKLSERKKPAADEVEIEVYATGLNFKEVLYASGIMSLSEGSDLSFGLECTGRITAVGENVKNFKPGDAVMAITNSAFSRFVIANADVVVHMPMELSFEEAATLPISYMTAYYALVKKGGLKKNEKVLIHSAAGGVGMAAINIAKWIGAEILATAGSDEKREYIRNLGVQDVMNSRSLEFAEEIKNKHGGVDVVLNSLSGSAVEKGLSILNYHGRFLEIGVRDILENNTINLGVFEKGISYIAINIGTHIKEFNTIFKEIVREVERGNLSPLPYKIFSISEVAEAFTFMSSSRHIGKIVISHKNEYGQQSGKDIKDKLLRNGISNKEGTQAFERIIKLVKRTPQIVGQVIVSTTDFSHRLSQGQITEQINIVNPFHGQSGVIKRRKRPQISVEYAPPVTQTEKELVAILEDFLGIDKVGINDNFFDIGASSLDIIQINAKINMKYTKDTSVVKMYSYPTVFQLARYLSGESDEAVDQDMNGEKIKSKEGLKKTLSIVKRKNRKL